MQVSYPLSNHYLSAHTLQVAQKRPYRPTQSLSAQAIPFGQAQSDLDSLYSATLEAQERLNPFLADLRLPGLPHDTADAVTPLHASRKMPGLHLKREDLTVTRAYKVRGALVAMSRAMESGKNSFVTVSTGNHAMGILKAAELLRPKAVQLVIPKNVLPAKAEKLGQKIEALKALGLSAQLVLHGENFEEARAHAQTLKGHYIDPYMDLDVISGQGTIGLELAEQLLPLLKESPHVTALDVMVPVGGGGLLTGIANGLISALKQSQSEWGNVTLRLIGLRLEDMKSPYGDAIRVNALEKQSLQRLEELGVTLREVSDLAIQKGLKFVQDDLSASVEGAAGVALSPVLSQQDCFPHRNKLTVAIVSGGNVAENA